MVGVARPRGARAPASSRLGSIRRGAPAVALRERVSTTPTVSLTRSRRPRRLPDRARVAPMRFPLETSSVEALGFDAKPLSRLRELITAHIAEGRYPAGQIAIARHGKLGVLWTLGDARLDPQRVPARDDTLWLLYSNTKVITACAVWILVELGALTFTDRVAAHWVAAVLIEALTKTDYRAFIREHVTEPLGLGGDLFVGLPDAAHDRAADTHEPAPDGTRHVSRRDETTAEARRAGAPGGGGYGTARAMAAFYQ